MVVGPNGAGKSSIVCAIALGLAGKPEVRALCCALNVYIKASAHTIQILGRQKTPQEFIKDGHEECTITFQIKNKQGTGSTHITRKIKRTKSNSTWLLNGRYPFQV